MIKREQYFEEIRPLIGKDIIKVLTGIKSLGQRCSKKFQEKNTIIFLVCESPSSTRRGGSKKIQRKNIICSLMKFKTLMGGKEAYQDSLSILM
ncbi:hypothetical protein [uncultured Methanobrevibacter sp.]|uniref:hypothetical protein n=1 Tax=uncultured Methanobrevibacter sp. TaxID=253161 RepID=UPI0025DE1415|nr:hypothetical protein [uncultured Methanobrevibacter sp.]